MIFAQQANHDTERIEANQAELVERILRVNRTDGRMEPLPGLFFNRISTATGVHGVAEPAFCVVAQGCKKVYVGDECYLYDPAHYLLFTAGLPYVSQTIEASAAQPYLSLRINLDPTLVSSVMVEAGHLSSRREGNVRATNVSPLDANLLDAVVRLVRLVDTPADAPVLVPLITREIIYRLLVGNQGGRLRYTMAQHSNTHRIAQAIQRFH